MLAIIICAALLIFVSGILFTEADHTIYEVSYIELLEKLAMDELRKKELPKKRIAGESITYHACDKK